MAKTATASKQLSVGDRVVARTALRGVPEGTTGSVIHVQGLSWIRYWVWFDNGLRVGTIDRAKLATPDEWERRHEVAAVSSASSSSSASSAAAAGGGESIGGVPAHLLERSKAARARWAAKG